MCSMFFMIHVKHEFIFKIYLFLIEGQVLYSIALVSTKHQHETAMGIPMLNINLFTLIGNIHGIAFHSL